MPDLELANVNQQGGQCALRRIGQIGQLQQQRGIGKAPIGQLVLEHDQRRRQVGVDRMDLFHLRGESVNVVDPPLVGDLRTGRGQRLLRLVVLLQIAQAIAPARRNRVRGHVVVRLEHGAQTPPCRLHKTVPLRFQLGGMRQRSRYFTGGGTDAPVDDLCLGLGRCFLLPAPGLA